MSPLADLFVCLRFFSRLPVPPTAEVGDHRSGDLADAAAMAPVAGAIIAILPCLVLLGTLGVGLPGALAAPLAIAALVVITGALHEDGLADCADGFGGGRTPERKLEIMRDSRIGTFGACAVALSLYLRAGALGTVAVRDPMLAGAALIAAASLSRALCLMPLALLPPARGDGLGKAAGRPVAATLVAATILAVVIVASASTAGATIGELTTAVALPAILALSVTSLAWRQIGGQTGDVAGAVQQITEIAVLLVFASG